MKTRKTSVTRILAFFRLLLRNESLDCLLQPHKGLLTFKREAGGEECRTINHGRTSA